MSVCLLEGQLLSTSTAQPCCRLHVGIQRYYFIFGIKSAPCGGGDFACLAELARMHNFDACECQSSQSLPEPACFAVDSKWTQQRAILKPGGESGFAAAKAQSKHLDWNRRSRPRAPAGLVHAAAPCSGDAPARAPGLKERAQPTPSHTKLGASHTLGC